MRTRTPYRLTILVAAVFSFCSVNVSAIPKAAEYEDAPVTTGVDVAHPKPSAKLAMQQPVEKRKAQAGVGKAGHKMTRPGKARVNKIGGHPPKTTHRKK